MERRISSIFLCLLTAVVLIVSGLCSTAIATAGGDVNIGNVSRFELDLISGTGEGPSPDWYSINGGEMIMHPADPGAGDIKWNIEFGEVELVGPFVSSVGGYRREMLDWLTNWSSLPNPLRITAKLYPLKRDGEPARAFEFHGVFPTFYQPPAVTAGDDTILEESLTFKPMYIEYASNPGRGISYEQDFEGDVLTGESFLFQIEGVYLPLYSCSPGGMELIYEESIGGDEPWENKPGEGSGSEWIGGDEPWENKPGNGEGSEWIGGDEPWENKPGKGRGVNWIGGDEPWENKPGRGGGSEWIGGDEPWENKPGNGEGSEWIGGDEPWENKPGNGEGSEWIGGDEPWENKPGKGQGTTWIGGDEPWENKPGRGGGAEWIGGDEPWENKFNYMYFSVSDVKFGTWIIQKEYDRADQTLKDLYDDFTSGRRSPNPTDFGTLSYLDSAGNEARTIDFFGYVPTSYDVVSVDLGGGNIIQMEVMEFEVMYCTYA